jgi:hypothetical protein
MMEVDEEESITPFNPIVETLKLQKQKMEQYERIKNEQDLEEKLRIMKDRKLRNNELFIKANTF